MSTSIADVDHLRVILFQGYFIRQVSCYTLLSGFRLPWPPSCCLNEVTPFLVSSMWSIGHICYYLRFIPHCLNCLPIYGPLDTSIDCLFLLSNRQHAFRVWELDESELSITTNHLLYNVWLVERGVCYPEGNFRTNQLLDVSMSLSPLSPIETSDLHVSTVGDLPSKFPSTSAKSGLAQHLSGPTGYTLTLTSET